MSTINRRKFLGICGAGLAGLLFPLPAIAEPALVPKMIADVPCTHIGIDYATKTIYLREIDGNGCTLLEVYNYLKNEWQHAPSSGEPVLSQDRSIVSLL